MYSLLSSVDSLETNGPFVNPPTCPPLE